MTIKFRDEDTYCIVDIFDKEITPALMAEIRLHLSIVSPYKRAALNMVNVSDLPGDFFDFIGSLPVNISLFNLSLNIYLLLFLGRYDKDTNIFINEHDFLRNKRRIVNRQFKLCSQAVV